MFQEGQEKIVSLGAERVELGGICLLVLMGKNNVKNYHSTS